MKLHLHRLRVPALYLLGALLVLTSTLPLATPAQAQEFEPWPRAVQIPELENRAFEPHLAYDGDGFLHVMFYSGENNDEWAIYYSNNRNGGNWSRARRISDSSGEQKPGNLVVGNDGVVHVIYERNKDSEIYYVESPDLGATWSKPVKVSNTGGNAYGAWIALDNNNVAHAVWSDTRGDGQPTVYYASKQPGNSWSSGGMVGSDSRDEFSPKIATSGSGANVRLHIVLQGRPEQNEGTQSTDIYYITNSGSSFLPSRNVSKDSGEWSLSPAIAANPQTGELYLAFDSESSGKNHDVVFTRSSDGGVTWAEPRNLLSRPQISLVPAVAVGLNNGTPQVHVTWSEGKRSALYVLYKPDTVEFGKSVETASTQTDVQESVDVAASQVINQIAVTYHAAGFKYKIFVTSRGTGAVVTGQALINDNAPNTTNRTVTFKLNNVQGAPDQLRYAVNRDVNDTDPWIPFTNTITLTLPDDGTCFFSISAQLRQTKDDRRSQILRDSILIDNRVQANIDVSNQYYDGFNSDALYTNRESFFVRVTNAFECSGLQRIAVNGQQPFLIENDAFENILVLPGTNVEGPRPVTVRVDDRLGNRVDITRTFVLDRTPPALVTGTLSVNAAANAPLLSPFVRLQINGLEATDNLYPGGAWGLKAVNIVGTEASTTTDTAPSLDWKVAKLFSGSDGSLNINWNVLSGLDGEAQSRSLAGKTVQIRAKIVDGAGNESGRTISATVQLAPNYIVPSTLVPLVQR